MIANVILQSSLDDLKAITRIDLCLLDPLGTLIAQTFEPDSFSIKIAQDFSESSAESQVIDGYHFFKISPEKQLKYILIAKGSSDDVYMIGKIGVSQIEKLIIAYKERYDITTFIQNLLLDNLLLADIYNRAQNLNIPITAKRIVYLIDTPEEKSSLEVLKELFADYLDDFIIPIDEHYLVYIKTLSELDDVSTLEKTATAIVDTLYQKLNLSVRVAYGTEIGDIKKVSKSYKEAKMALDVGEIFYREKSIIPYDTLGIGRLIYQLPIPLCKMFLHEIFGEKMPEELNDEETLTTINNFFENNLNVSETARQLFIHRNTLVYRLEKLQRSIGLDIRIFDEALIFKIALMVANYMDYMDDHLI